MLTRSTDGSPATSAPASSTGLAAAGSFALRAVLVLVALAVAGLGAAVLVLRGEALPGTTVAGVEVSGLGRDELRARVEQDVAARLARPLPLQAAGTSYPVVPSQVGLQVDVGATVERALEGGPRAAVEALLGAGRDVRPVAALDDALVAERVEQVRRQVDREPGPGGFRVDGTTVVPVAPQTGRELQVPETTARVRQALLTQRRAPVPAPVETAPAPVPQSAVDQVVAQARRALQAPVVLTGAGAELTVAPQELAPLLTTRVAGDALALRLDPERTRALLRERVAGLEREARDARLVAPRPRPVLRDQGDTAFSARPAEVRLEPAVTGRDVPLDDVVGRLAAAVAEGAREAELPVTVREPDVPTSALEGVDQLVGSFTTAFPCCQNRVTNIQRIAALVDGTVVMPGDTFSLNRAAGPRTTSRGFLADGAIIDGELVDVVGGGVSQFATTLYNAAWFAGLPVLDHKPHSRYISRYPAGREATLDFRSIDLVFRNDTGAPLVLRTATTGTTVTAALYGHTGDRTVRSDTGPRQPRDGGGFRVRVTRAVVQDGEVVDRDSTTWTYEPPLD